METSLVHTFYTVTIRYFLLMFLMLLITGIWMLLLHNSLSIESLTDYYVKKSLYGILDVLTPHLFAMGTVIFILTHLLSLKNKNSAFESKVTLLLFLVMLISNFSLFFITELTSWMIWVKLISTILFLLLSFLTMWRVLFRHY
ncbi:MAG: Unknown protein [uncultured Sulfurovum sp.]|uniref:Uncharacterized protein n=1 Tax=uncultured Sulfurovum sp. TaxID=269237 RepID=A0A6S6RUX9_9BACT|nr:MAG: Unknown protein [uncultured Sulfurovum sp.]